MWIKRRVAIRDHSAEANLFARRTIIALAGVLALIILLLSNLYHLQVDKHKDYQTRADGNRIKVRPVPPNRGLIYDRNGILLAKNTPIYSLEVVPEDAGDIDELLERIKPIVSISDDQLKSFNKSLKQNRRRRFNPVTLRSKLSEEEAARFSVNQHLFDGVYIEAFLKRNYPYKDTLTHAMGYVARINQRDAKKIEFEGQKANYAATRNIGKLGLERYYQDDLHGTVGYRKVEVNNRGRVLRELDTTAPTPGTNLHLHLDIELQKAAQAALKGKRGAIVVLDAKDNGILAFYSNPSYDPNLFVHGISSKAYGALLNSKDRPLINRVTQGQYPPASTIKPHIALLGLDENIVTEQTRIWDPGFFEIRGVDHKYRDWKRWGHEWVDVHKAIEQSCDTYFYDLALKLGVDKISQRMVQFGFGESTGVDIYEETNAILPSREWKRGRWRQPWYAGDTVSIGIGQGYWTATPLQIALSTSVLANKGEFFEPKLVKSKQLPGETEIVDVPAQDRPPVQQKTLSHWDVIHKSMYNTVKKGTASRAFKDHLYKAAGKTGTAQLVAIKQGERYDAKKLSERHRDNALFVGFAPFDSPEMVVAVVVENTGGGSSVAAPIARLMMDQFFIDRPEFQAKKDAK